MGAPAMVESASKTTAELYDALADTSGGRWVAYHVIRLGGGVTYRARCTNCPGDTCKTAQACRDASRAA